MAVGGAVRPAVVVVVSHGQVGMGAQVQIKAWKPNDCLLYYFINLVSRLMGQRGGGFEASLREHTQKKGQSSQKQPGAFCN